MRQKSEAICGYCKNFCRNIGKYLPIETLSVRAHLGYAYLRADGEGEDGDLFIALALLPPGVDVGTRLHSDMLSFTVIE